MGASLAGSSSSDTISAFVITYLASCSRVIGIVIVRTTGTSSRTSSIRSSSTIQTYSGGGTIQTRIRTSSAWFISVKVVEGCFTETGFSFSGNVRTTRALSRCSKT